MNPLTRAASIVVRRIPRQILEKVFLKVNNPWINQRNSLEFEIINQVIRPRVIVDCDILGGMEDYIRLTGLPFERTPELMSIVHIPKERTNGRTITSALYMNYMDYTANMYGNTVMNFKPCSITPLSAGAGAIAQSYSSAGMLGTARLEIVAENTILVKEQVYSPQNATLRCVLSNDAELNNLSIRTYTQFCDLCTLAVKSHIWTELVVLMDQGEVQAGRTIGAFRTLVDKYESAEEDYVAFLPRWKRILFMNDKETYNRFIRAQISIMR